LCMFRLFSFLFLVIFLWVWVAENWDWWGDLHYWSQERRGHQRYWFFHQVCFSSAIR
jgi:hypothetical protein